MSLRPVNRQSKPAWQICQKSTANSLLRHSRGLHYIQSQVPPKDILSVIKPVGWQAFAGLLAKRRAKLSMACIKPSWFISNRGKIAKPSNSSLWPGSIGLTIDACWARLVIFHQLKPRPCIINNFPSRLRQHDSELMASEIPGAIHIRSILINGRWKS